LVNGELLKKVSNIVPTFLLALCDGLVRLYEVSALPHQTVALARCHAVTQR